MTAYTTLRAIKEGRISFDTLLTVSRNAAAQQPTKMGFKVGTRVTVDNALEDADGEIGQRHGRGDRRRRRRLDRGLRRHDERQRAPARHDASRNFVNPNGLPAENHVTSARDLGILARALIMEFPEDDSYWHIHAIQYGNRVMHNYNSLLDRYPGADGMKTGFICASGYNVVASATRNGRRLIAIVLGAYSGAVRAQKAAALARTRLQQRRPHLADALARHRRRTGADRRTAAQSARRNVRRPSPQAAGGRQRRRAGRRRVRRPATTGRRRPSCCPACGRRTASSCSGRRSIPSRRSRCSPDRPIIRMPVQTAEPRAKKKKRIANKETGEKKNPPPRKTAPKPRAAPKHAKHAKPKVSSAN